jgi:ADP-ribose pyrophosphatase YjhB (NUDIX family)
MSTEPSRWRPSPTVRPVAVGVVRRGSELLLMAVRDDGGVIKGWRPLGGTIEFGERAAAALVREFREELGEAIIEPRPLAVLENLYEHHGARGHEIVFVFETAFADARAYQRSQFDFVDGGVRNEVEWVDRARFVVGEQRLFPEGLLDLLRDGADRR